MKGPLTHRIDLDSAGRDAMLEVPCIHFTVRSLNSRMVEGLAPKHTTVRAANSDVTEGQFRERGEAGGECLSKTHRDLHDCKI